MSAEIAWSRRDDPADFGLTLTMEQLDELVRKALPGLRRIRRLNQLLAYHFWREGWHGGFW